MLDIHAFRLSGCDPLPGEVENYMNPDEAGNLLGQVWLISGSIFVVSGCDVTYNSGNYDSPVKVELKPHNTVFSSMDLPYNILQKEGKLLCNSVDGLPKVGELWRLNSDPLTILKIVEMKGSMFGVDWMDPKRTTHNHVGVNFMLENSTRIEDKQESKMTPQYRVFGEVHVGDVWQIDFGEPSGKKLVVIEEITNGKSGTGYSGKMLIGGGFICMTDCAMRDNTRAMLIATSIADLPKVGEIWKSGINSSGRFGKEFIYKVTDIRDCEIYVHDEYHNLGGPVSWKTMVKDGWNRVEPWPDNGPCKIEGDVKIDKDGCGKIVPKQVMVSLDGQPGEWMDITEAEDVMEKHLKGFFDSKSSVKYTGPIVGEDKALGADSLYDYTNTYSFEFPDGSTVSMPNPNEEEGWVKVKESNIDPYYRMFVSDYDEDFEYNVVHKEGLCWLHDWNKELLEHKRAKIVSICSWKKELVEFEEQDQETWQYLKTFPLLNGRIK